MKRALLIIGLALPASGLAADPGKGKEIVLGKADGNCLLCHEIPGADRPAGNIGPSLAGIGAKLPAEQLRLHIVDQSRFNPDTVMPPYGRTEGLRGVAPQYRGKPLLTREQIDDAVAFLLSLK